MSDSTERLNAALEGRYVIERELGQGGMATVYLADDLKHNRKVALKVLRPELAAVVGAERFLAEIETTANLQHPHILPLFDSGDADGFLFYVMPFVEGETLRERLDREHQLPVDEAVKITTDLAEALDYAHRNKVIHRDIKPANILMHEGRPLIADFGIALAVGAAGGGRLTETGLSLGTPYYMSPEQATGDQSVGSATDTYALGAVLYEMLTGDPPYMGSTAQAVLGQIITGEPVSAAKKRSSVPANVDASLRKALEKLPADRFTSAQEFVKALGDEHFRYGELAGAGAGSGPWNRLTIAMTLIATAFGVVAGWSLLRPAPPLPVERFVALDGLQGVQPMALLPDGSGMVFRQIDDFLWLRRWDNLDPVLIGGTERVFTAPAVSPDGQAVAFIATPSQLKVTPLVGGEVRTLADDARCCHTWGSDGFVYYQSLVGGINRVRAAGGVVESVTQLDGGLEIAHSHFQVLPESDLGVFSVVVPGVGRIVAQRLSTGERKTLVQGYKPFVTATGHLVFAFGDQIMAAPFDVGAMALTSPPTTLVEGVVRNGPNPLYTVSESGDLLYQTGQSAAAPDAIVWVARDGVVQEVDPEWADDFSSLRLSPDGTRLAVTLRERGVGTDIWIKQLDRGPFSKLTFEQQSFDPSWTPDGTSITFASDRAGNPDIYRKRADGSALAELILDHDRPVTQPVWSPDGDWLVFTLGGLQSDVYGLQPDTGDEPVPLVAEDGIDESWPAVSPDGRWLAYVSFETGEEQVYVRPFPNVNDAKWLVSTDGGTQPKWAKSGRELFYRSATPEMVAVDILPGSTFTTGEHRVLFEWGGLDNDRWDVAPGDQRFLFVRARFEDGNSQLILVQNWFEELRQRVAN